MPTPILPALNSIRTTQDYDALLKALDAGVTRKIAEVELAPLPVISVSGALPPADKPYQDAIAALYGICYSLKMGLKFGQLAKPARYFDYRVGALETLWWSLGKVFDIADAATLRWQAYLMVPPFVTAKLVDEARELARAKHPEIPYERASLATIDEGRSVQVLHVGRYDMERPTLAALHAYMAEHGLVMNGKHHEIYVSDPRRAQPDKLKTVIRLPVKAR